MWNERTSKKLSIIIAIAMFSCLLINVVLLQLSKNRYGHNVKSELQNLVQQQQFLLQRLSKNLQAPISSQDLESISINLRAYEDLLFALSKQKLAVPLSLHYVSLTAPQQIISSNGSVDHHILAPDDAYYLRVAEEPDSLAFSKEYVKPEMPEYSLFNWGLGIVHNNAYHGQLDVQVAIESVHDYVQKSLTDRSKIFSFKLSINNMLHPEVIVNHLEYSLTLLRYTIFEMLILGSIILIKVAVLRFRRSFRANKSELMLSIKQLEFLTTQSTLIKSADELQYRYGMMQYNDKTISIKQLLDDIYTANAPLAAARKITLSLIENDTNLQFQGDNLRLMQILSGILYEIILLLSASSTVKLQLVITELQKDMQQLQFKFSDNGFYNRFVDRNVAASSADVRSQGWNNINDLIELEGGDLEHLHTAYSGNVVSFTITRKVAQKIVNIENYYS